MDEFRIIHRPTAPALVYQNTRAGWLFFGFLTNTRNAPTALLEQIEKDRQK